MSIPTSPKGEFFFKMYLESLGERDSNGRIELRVLKVHGRLKDSCYEMFAE